ncbi:MAG: ATP-binding protein [Spirochaetales bacterium]|jgi:uncharacterized protein|nr:ATP-binding protein [Spirochaetales bacterium]
MKRIIEEKIIIWKTSSRRKPLIIRGARQTGKTWLVNHFGKTHFDDVVVLDFEKRRDLHQIFSGSLEPKTILKSLELALGKIVPGKTLLFFDEIQTCPKAITSLRYFYEEMPELHIVSAGSLLEFAFGEISIPVGRVSYINLYPMTFYEYLLALGNEVMAEEVLSPAPDSSDFIQFEVLKELNNYFLVGGMPEAVKTWCNTSSLLEVFEVQDDILNSYRDDFSKYKPHVDIHCLDNVFKQSSLRIGEQIKYTALDQQFSGQTNRKALELLEKARIINKIYSTDPSGIPLGAGVNQKKFKISFLDIGLMQRLTGLPVPDNYYHSNILDLYKGKLAEQYIAQEMAAVNGRELFYWAREAKSSTAEVDYLIYYKNSILPIEVKSGKGGSLRSMHQLLSDYPAIASGLVLYADVRKELLSQKLLFYPLYYISSILNHKG